MGKSPTIEELAAADDKFEKYLATKRAEIEERQKETQKAMDADIVKFYQEGGWDDRKPLCVARYVDIQNVQEWSLTNVNNILSAVSGAIFGSANPPPGTAVTNAASNVVVQAIPTLQLLVLSRAFQAVQGILEAFTVKSSTSITMQSKIEVVAPGVTTFIYVNSNSFRNQSFFSNGLISQYFYLIEAYTSVKQLGDYSKMQDLLLFEKEKTALRNIANRILDKMQEFDSDDKLEPLSKQLDGIYDRLESVTERINDLSKQERLMAQALVQQIRLRKSLLLAKS